MATLKEAIEEAYASAPDNVIALHALEIDHPSFTEPARVVNWPVTGPEPEEFWLLHEDDAPLNPGDIVRYLGVPFQLMLPESSDSSPGSMQIRVALHADFDKYLEAAATNPGVINANYRNYIKGREKEGPAEIWLDITITSPRREGGQIIADGAVLTFMFKPYGALYMPSGYPALVSGR